jgi:hypothetical protein
MLVTYRGKRYSGMSKDWQYLAVASWGLEGEPGAPLDGVAGAGAGALGAGADPLGDCTGPLGHGADALGTAAVGFGG